MLIVKDEELRLKAIQALRDEYMLDRQRPGLHQSELSYCLTKAFYNKTDPLPPNETEVKLFAIGFAMEKVLLSREEQPEPMVIDGIHLSLDTLKLFGPADLKTTRKAPNGRKDEDGFQIPETWKRQFMAYRYGLNRTYVHCQCGEIYSQCSCNSPSIATSPQLTFSCIVVHLIQPEITAWTLTFTPEELEENWSRLVDRSNVLESMIAAQDPMPFTSNEEWECTSCNYKLRCQLTASVRRYQRPENIVDIGR